MKNIIHFSQDFSEKKPKLGGHTRILNMAADGNRHYIFTTGDDYKLFINYFNYVNVTVIQLPIRRLRIYSLINQPYLILRLSYLIDKYLIKENIKVDALIGHSQLVNFYILCLIKLKRLNNIKLIWEYNGIWGFEKNDNIKIFIRNKLQIFSQFIINKIADGIIFQTHSSLLWMKKHYKISNKNIVVLENAYEIKSDVNINKQISFPLRIIVFGLLDDLNGLNFLIESISELNKIDNLKIDIYGNGIRLDKIKEIEKEYNFIQYKGIFESRNLTNILSNYDFGLIPRINCLGSNLYIPTKLIEIMAHGVIPICSGVGGLTELVKHGYNGFIFETENTDDLCLKICEIKSEFTQIELLEISRNATKTVLKSYNILNFNTKFHDFLLLTNGI